MKKAILVSLCSLLVATSATANYYGFRTNNCNPATMHAELERAVREHKTVITEVVCDAPIATVSEPVYVAPVEPVYAVEYVQAPIDAGNIPVVDCVPGPIACGCNTCGC